MFDKIKAWIVGQGWKIVRSAVLTSITAAIVSFTDNPANIAWVPIIASVSSWLRKKFPGKVDWLPV